MRKRRTDAPTRSDLTRTVDDRKTEFDEKTDALEKHADDVETERETLESLDLTGTSDAAEAVEQAVEAAQETSVREFEEDGETLEQVQNEGEEFEKELHERSDAASSDMGKIADGENRLHSDEAKSELEKAKMETQRDIELLDEHEREAQEARQESERLHEEQRARIQAAGRS
ncbi:MAG: hypothetical protein J5J06_15755 [Phycisphaerae bacterium]|nr:hypothetical protein [Phycisphaerae bacterium]